VQDGGVQPDLPAALATAPYNKVRQFNRYGHV
jgi:hypothetical protein